MGNLINKFDLNVKYLPVFFNVRFSIENVFIPQITKEVFNFQFPRD